MEPVQPVQMNTYQSNIYRKDLSWLYFYNDSTYISTYLFLYLIQQFQVATRSTSPDMTTVFHTWPYGRFIQSNLRRKKLHRTNQGSNFLGGSFSNRNCLQMPPNENVALRAVLGGPLFKNGCSGEYEMIII